MVQKREKYPVSVGSLGQNALLMLEVRGDWADGSKKANCMPRRKAQIISNWLLEHSVSQRTFGMQWNLWHHRCAADLFAATAQWHRL